QFGDNRYHHPSDGKRRRRGDKPARGQCAGRRQRHGQDGWAHPVVSDMLNDNGLQMSDVDLWAIHPGGPKIIEQSVGSLGIPAERAESLPRTSTRDPQQGWCPSDQYP
ncbi:hypothetical protein F0Q45_08070, partial [Mycobacterium simiae]